MLERVFGDFDGTESVGIVFDDFQEPNTGWQVASDLSDIMDQCVQVDFDPGGARRE
jgi:hypothetical protein